ncbi:HTTM domain-containing protein [Puia sp.]|uniref:HTTM domain-containing protein n=1 Tax=Puia sp. TaxID=2045100 RepID=UPI0039C924F0
MGINQRLYINKSIAPLAILRITFGAVLLYSTLRFIAKGWVREFYIAPRFHFTFYGFDWVRPLPAAGMYLVFGVMAVAALFIAAGFLYRVAVAAFLLCFVYVELLDKTYYLNHYYFVSLFVFLLLLVPANRYWSVDVLLRPVLRVTRVPAWTIDIFRVQLLLVYVFAGLSKLTADWLLHAEPLRIWLPAQGLPIWMAYAFSWCGALFDLSIGFLLWWRRTRVLAYVFVVIFHIVTALLFKIGVFPYVMIAATLVFFDWKPGPGPVWQPGRAPGVLLGVYFVLQILIPMRFLLYPGRLLWTEQGYRFSWRVMLMEKSGTSFFYVREGERKGEVDNAKFLTPLQERQMATQPDMILQYAHYLSGVYGGKPVTVESYVTLNGSGSRLYLDSSVDLSRECESFLPKKWILTFKP